MPCVLRSKIFQVYTTIMNPVVIVLDCFSIRRHNIVTLLEKVIIMMNYLTEVLNESVNLATYRKSHETLNERVEVIDPETLRASRLALIADACELIKDWETSLQEPVLDWSLENVSIAGYVGYHNEYPHICGRRAEVNGM